MPIKYLSNLSLELNELQNVVIQNLSGSLPGTPNVGRMAMGTTNDRMAWASSAGWHELYPFASTNTASTGVLRDGSGNFAAGTITASLTGNASTASALQTARNISISGKATATGVAFDGTASIALSVSALAVNPSDISVTTGYVIVGSGGSGSAVAKSSILLSEWGAPSSNVSFGSQRILNLADPVNDQDAATKNYVDAVASGLDAKPSARVKTAGALPANTRSGNVLTADVNGALTSIDGVTVAVNDIVLVTDESTGANNGLYVVDSLGGASSQWSMTRHEKADESSEVTPGMFVFIEEGTLYADTGWVLSNDGTVVLNVTALTFVQFSGSATFTAGNGLVKSGSTFHFAQTSAYTTGALPFASGSTSIGFDASNLSYDDANNLLTATNLKTTSTLKASTTSAGYAQQWQTAGDNILGIQVSDLGGSGVTAKFVGYSASHFVQTDSVLGWNSSYGHWYVDGALGIGQDAAADERLHVYQTLDGNVRAYVQNPNTGSSATAAMRLGTASGSYYLQAERANHKFSIIEDSTDVLTLHNQSVGVGTTSPSAGAIGGKLFTFNPRGKPHLFGLTGRTHRHRERCR